MGLWYLLRTAPGALRWLAEDELEGFLRGEQPLPAAEGHASWIGLEVDELRGTALGVKRLWFGRMPVDATGRLDPREALGRIRERLAVHDRLHEGLDTGEPVVDARDLFLAKRLHHARSWEPTDEDVAALRALVEARAGWAML